MCEIASKHSSMISLHQVAKRVGGRQLFRQLEFSWNGPGMICVTGPNGSGKTTLLSMIAGALGADSGEIEVNGSSMVNNHGRTITHVSYAPDGCPIYPFITGREWLNFVKSIRSTDALLEGELLTALSLHQYVDSPFNMMSLGTAKKFILLAAVISVAPVLIMDEPTNGLDTRSFEVLEHVLQQRAATGLVLLTCHDPGQRHRLGGTEVELDSLEAA